MQATAGLGEVDRARELERLAVVRHQIEVAERGHRDARQDAVDREIDRAFRGTVRLGDATLVHQMKRKIVGAERRIDLEKDRLAFDMGLGADRVVAAECLRLEHRPDQGLRDQGQIQMLFSHAEPRRDLPGCPIGPGVSQLSP
jgi:hypothetical protein